MMIMFHQAHPLLYSSPCSLHFPMQMGNLVDPRSMIRNESIINESGFFDSDKFLLSDFFDSSEIVSPSIQLGDIFIASTTKVLHKGTKPIEKTVFLSLLIIVSSPNMD